MDTVVMYLWDMAIFKFIIYLETQLLLSLDI